MGKGSKKRPMQISRARWDLNNALYYGEITLEQWQEKDAELKREENVKRT